MTLSWPKMTAPIASLAARRCLAVVSAARTIMSSNFSRLSPDDVAIRLTPQKFLAPYPSPCLQEPDRNPLPPPQTRGGSPVSAAQCTLFCNDGDCFGAIVALSPIIIFSRAGQTRIHLH